MNQLYRELGSQVLARYQLLYKDEKGILAKVEELYADYLKWYLQPQHPENTAAPPLFVANSRQRWQQLLYHPHSTGPHVVSQLYFLYSQVIAPSPTIGTQGCQYNAISLHVCYYEECGLGWREWLFVGAYIG